MEYSEIRRIIHETFSEVFQQQNPNLEPVQPTEETRLLETGLDSLGFAVLITKLEEEFDFDPFTESDEAYYPATFKELVDFYFKNKQ